MNIKKKISGSPWVWPLLGILLLWIGISILNGNFEISTLGVNINLSCFLLIMTIGQAVVITTGEGAIDLSLTYVVSFVPYLISGVSLAVGNYAAGVLAGLAACIVIGVANGVVNYYLKVPAMITTLAVGYIVYSLTMVISSRQISGAPNESFKRLIQTGTFLGIPVRIFITAAVVLAAWFVINRTVFGWQLRAAGMNRTAAGFAGVNVPKVVITAFIMTAVLTFFASIMLNAYLGMGGQNAGSAYLLPCVAAAVIGGTSLNGGKTSMVGIVFASIMWTMLNAFLNIALTQWHLNSAIKNLIQGAVLILVLIAAVPKKQINE